MKKNLKPVPKEKKKSLDKLPKKVRNKMDYMKNGGEAKVRGMGAATQGGKFQGVF